MDGRGREGDVAEADRRRRWSPFRRDRPWWDHPGGWGLCLAFGVLWAGLAALNLLELRAEGGGGGEGALVLGQAALGAAYLAVSVVALRRRRSTRRVERAGAG